jgi:nucleoside phosphorylase
MSDTAVIMTATDIEYNAVLHHLDDVKPHLHKAGTRFEIGTLRGTACRIALVLANVGNRASAVIAERAIQEFAPPALLFCGIAGSLWDKPAIGDVVVAERVYAYQGGTSEHDGLKARPRTWEAPHQVSQIAHALNRSGDWRGRLPTNAGAPEVRFGPVAAGEVLKNSDRSLEAEFIRRHYNDAIAIEMEAAGVAEAGHLNNAMVGIVRGISDMSDGTKNSKADAQTQPKAAANAAAFAVALAQALLDDRKEHPVTTPDELSLAALEAAVLTEGVKFLFQQGNELLQRRRIKKDDAQEMPDVVAEPRVLPVADLERVSAFEADLVDLVDELRTRLPERGPVSADDRELLRVAESVRRVLGAVYKTPIVFEGEQASAGVHGSVDADEVAGYVAAVRADLIDGRITGTTRVRRVEEGGEAVGVDLRSRGRA